MITPAQARENAQNEVTDIEALAKSQPFNRYFVRRMNELYADAFNKALTAPTADEREKNRHRANLLTELSEMPAKDRDSAEKFLRTPDRGPDRPTQAG